jgi:hypothetical protein
MASRAALSPLRPAAMAGLCWYLSLGVYNRRRCGISGLDTLEQINYLLFFCVHVSLLDLFVAMLYRLNFVTAFVTI